MRFRVGMGVILGGLVPLLYWLGLWFSLQPVTGYIEWFRNIHLPEWLMWPLIPWGSIHAAIIAYDNVHFRRFIGLAMFVVALAGNVVISICLALSIHGVWGGETGFDEVPVLVRGSLYLDAVPAITATLLGLFLARRQKENKCVGEEKLPEEKT